MCIDNEFGSSDAISMLPSLQLFIQWLIIKETILERAHKVDGWDDWSTNSKRKWAGEDLDSTEAGIKNVESRSSPVDI
jgi:hypothetical protein